MKDVSSQKPSKNLHSTAPSWQEIQSALIGRVVLLHPPFGKRRKTVKNCKIIREIEVAVIFVHADTPRVVRARNPLVRILPLRYKTG